MIRPLIDKRLMTIFAGFKERHKPDSVPFNGTLKVFNSGEEVVFKIIDGKITYTTES